MEENPYQSPESDNLVRKDGRKVWLWGTFYGLLFVVSMLTIVITLLAFISLVAPQFGIPHRPGDITVGRLILWSVVSFFLLRYSSRGFSRLRKDRDKSLG